MGNEPSSMQLWSIFFPPLPYCTPTFHLFFFCLCLCCHISLPTSSYLSLSCTPSLLWWEGDTERTINLTCKSHHLRKVCLLCFRHCYSAVLLHFLTRSILIKSFHFLRPPEVMFLQSGFGFRDNKVRFFFLDNLGKQSWNLFGADVFLPLEEPF